MQKPEVNQKKKTHNSLSYKALCKWAMQDLNLRHPACKSEKVKFTSHKSLFYKGLCAHFLSNYSNSTRTKHNRHSVGGQVVVKTGLSVTLYCRWGIERNCNNQTSKF